MSGVFPFFFFSSTPLRPGGQAVFTSGLGEKKSWTAEGLKEIQEGACAGFKRAAFPPLRSMFKARFNQPIQENFGVARNATERSTRGLQENLFAFLVISFCFLLSFPKNAIVACFRSRSKPWEGAVKYLDNINFG